MNCETIPFAEDDEEFIGQKISEFTDAIAESFDWSLPFFEKNGYAVAAVREDER